MEVLEQSLSNENLKIGRSHHPLTPVLPLALGTPAQGEGG